MKVSIHTGKSYSKKLESGNTLEISIYPSKWYTEVKMSEWTSKHDRAVSFLDKKYFNYEKILSLKLAKVIEEHKLNKHSQRVSGVDIV